MLALDTYEYEREITEHGRLVRSPAACLLTRKLESMADQRVDKPAVIAAPPTPTTTLVGSKLGVSDSSPPQQLTRKPVLTTKEVSDLLLRLFNIQADTLKEYESYDDRTYYVKTEQSFQTSEFILKVLNSENTASEGTVDAQMRVLRHLESYPDLCCQVPLPNLAGDFLSCEMIRNEVRNGLELTGCERELSAVRLFKFIPGKVLANMSSLPARFFCDVGKHLGQLQKTLQEYPGGVEPLKLKSKHCKWSLENVPLIREHLPLVKDNAKRELLENVIGRFEKDVVPVIGHLRQGIIYGDFNENNVIVSDDLTRRSNVTPAADENHQICAVEKKEGKSGVSKLKISGLIDFDDMGYTCLLFEVALAIAYMMIVSDKPIEDSGNVLVGFETVSPLTCEERGLLKVSVAGRFAQSLLMGVKQSKMFPDNAYVGTFLIKGWNLLELWWGQTEEELQELWDRCRNSGLDFS
ncbi:hydroxylysine kinase-like [Asterias rubens]|uniref:hydroxylysine kinase-like n=1 Tax=Asterias rubens TaxID=7604 RepID=UPI001455B34B|nr:hydroxylysine kinase-like [Asterias rubens]